MATISYTACDGCVHIAGTCHDSDGPGIADALTGFLQLSEQLVLDLTAVNTMSRGVAEQLVRCLQEATWNGQHLRLRADGDSDAARLIDVVMAERGRVQPAE
ncbi:MAG TPA: hypothetical protein VI452_11600 [Marmoricola sp.]